MKALSIRQPWAWLILNAGKDIENRQWPTRFRGTVLVHASKSCTKYEHENGVNDAEMLGFDISKIPAWKNTQRGGIVGSVEIIDCVTKSGSPWFYGDYGFVLRNPKILPFRPYVGMLGFFDVPDFVVQS